MRFRFSLSGLFLLIMLAGAAMLYVRARLFEQKLYACEAVEILGDLPVEPFEEALRKRLQAISYEADDSGEGHQLVRRPSSLRNSSANYQPKIFRGQFPNGKTHYIHIFSCPNPAQPEYNL